jgi:hypothetical protein
MIPQIKPIGGTQICWDVFLQACTDSLGYSPIRGVDSLARELSDPAKLLASLAAFHNKQNVKAPLAAIRNAGSLLRHLSYAFLVYCDEHLISDIRERSLLNVTSTVAADGERVAYVSGSLFDFHTATLECCTEDSPFDIRYLFDAFVLYFESIGLGDIWHDQRKKTLKDKTFLLEYIP